MKTGERKTEEILDDHTSSIEQEYVGSRLDQHVSGLMFWAGILYLLVLSMLLHLSEGRLETPIGRGSITALAIIWLVFPLEYAVQRITGASMRPAHLWAACLPWLRVAVRDHGRGDHLWFPVWSWVIVDRDLEHRLHQAFALPMMGVALFVLPLVSIEYIWSDTIIANRFWQQLIQSATGLIWTAFALEFILMMAVVKYKWNYVKRHWIDLIVVLLPLISFLPALRLARLARLNQLGRTVRLYRVRGLLMRTWRAIVALEVIDRLIWRTPESRLQRMQLLRFEMQRELDLMDAKIQTYCEKYRLEHPRTESEGKGNVANNEVLEPMVSSPPIQSLPSTQLHAITPSDDNSATEPEQPTVKKNETSNSQITQNAHVIRLSPTGTNRELRGSAVGPQSERRDHVA